MMASAVPGGLLPISMASLNTPMHNTSGNMVASIAPAAGNTIGNVPPQQISIANPHGGPIAISPAMSVAMNAAAAAMAIQQQQQHHHQQQQQSINASDSSAGLCNGQQPQDRCSPSRSLSSASPPSSSDMNVMASHILTEQEEKQNAEYLKELLTEKENLECLLQSSSAQQASAEDGEQRSSGISGSQHTLKLLELEISRLQAGKRASSLGYDGGNFRDPIKYVDVYRERPIRLTVRVLVPVREHPKFNFVGKLLGPKGNSMKRLQEETMTKMAVLGRGSMRDKQKEEELRASNDPKYQHLQEELHVEITAFAPPAEAHARVAYALTEIRKYIIPDANDEIRQEQMREMEILAANGGDSISVAAAMAAAAMVSDPLKRAAMMRPVVSATAAAAASPVSATANPNLSVLNQQQQTQQSLQAAAALRAGAVLSNRVPNAASAPTMAAAPYFAAAGTPLVRTSSLCSPQQPQKLYSDEMLLEVQGQQEASSDTSSANSLSTSDAWTTMVSNSSQSLKASSSMDSSKYRQQPYLRPT